MIKAKSKIYLLYFIKCFTSQRSIFFYQSLNLYRRATLRAVQRLFGGALLLNIKNKTRRLRN